MTPRKTHHLPSHVMNTSQALHSNNPTSRNNNGNTNSIMPPMGTEEIDLTCTDSPYSIQNPAYDAFEIDQAIVTNGTSNDNVFPLVDFKETEA